MPTAAARGPVLCEVSDHRDLVRYVAEQTTELVQIGQQRFEAILRIADRVGRHHPGGAVESGFANARDVHLAPEKSGPDAGRVALSEIVAERALPDERVDVQIDDVARVVDL